MEHLQAVLEKASVEPGLIFEGAKLDLEFKLSFLDRVKAERLARAEGAQVGSIQSSQFACYTLEQQPTCWTTDDNIRKPCCRNSENI